MAWRNAHLPAPHAAQNAQNAHGDLLTQFLDNIPDSLLRPFVENRVIGVVLIAVAFGVAAQRLKGQPRELAEQAPFERAAHAVSPSLELGAIRALILLWTVLSCCLWSRQNVDLPTLIRV